MKITKDDEGLRFDKYLRRTLKHASLGMIYEFIRKGNVLVNNKKQKQNYRLQTNDELIYTIPIENFLASTKKPAYKQRFTILFEDQDLLIVNKPAGLASHGGTGITDNLIAEARTYLKDITSQSSLAHRLDRGTSGIVIIAKNKTALRSINQALKRRDVNKTYLALVEGTMQPPQGTLTHKLERIKEDFTTKIITSEQGKIAKTSYQTLKNYPQHTLVKLQLHTGRMHQLRAQLTITGHPIVGDNIYGKEEQPMKRLFLHASQLSFQHPTTGKTISLSAPLPPELETFLKQL
ncbi:MAG TPA: RluA family pseudouridine synthase [Candidatus Nanoarchaeia archaeon]|nr:RluA family pseudouridine synthase [Candidatus Nanoarchaeia archaeon]